MRVRLVNDNGYRGMDYVDFPVEVEATRNRHGVSVHYNELTRIGADSAAFYDPEDPDWYFGPDSWELVCE